MRVSMHSGRGSAHHNDHPQTKKKPGYNPELTPNNENYTIMDTDDTSYSAEAGEALFYQTFFGDALAKQNRKCEERGQYGRVRSMDEWMKARQHQATETIFQIGDKDEHPDAELLTEAFDEFIEWKAERYKDNLRVISASCHVDESTPHIHVREVWFYHDEDGIPQPGIKKAMAEAGVPLPDPTKPEGRDNYRKATVDAECRAKWQDIVKSKGLEIETKPKERTVGHMGCDAYREYAKSMETVERLQDNLKAHISILERERQDLSAEREKLEIEAQTLREDIRRDERAKAQAELERRDAERQKKWDKNFKSVSNLATKYQDKNVSQIMSQFCD